MPGHDGISSVTEILAPWADFSHIDPAVLAHAAERGTKLHDYVAAHLLGEWIPRVEAEVVPYFDSFKRWADMVEDVVSVEREYVCDCFGYLGHVDAVLRLKGDSGLTLIDWKSPILESKTWPLQIAGGYWHLVEKHSVPPLPVELQRCGAIQCRKDGKVARMREYTGNVPNATRAFLGAASVHNYLKERDVGRERGMARPGQARPGAAGRGAER